MKDDHDAFAEFAAKVSNDIAEDIDCRETRKQLREVVRFYAMQSCENHAWRKLAEGEVLTARLAITLLLPFAKRSRSVRAAAARKIAAVVLKD